MSMPNVGREYFCCFRFLVVSLAALWFPMQSWAEQGILETPTPGSFQSGIGLVRGWVCTASRVDIEIDATVVIQSAYGEERGDTQTTCGDTNNGFSVQINWNELGEGAHVVRALADGEEVGRATVVVATLGQPFFLGAQGEFPVQPFPQAGRTTRLRWQESRQQFVLSSGATPATGGGSPRNDAKLEDPQPGSFQSGVGLIRGWICTATRIEAFIDGQGPIPAVYQEPRGDTQPTCNDTNNGFSIQVNWNDLGDGTHTVRVLADGSEVGQATFTVVTLGLGSFPLGLAGSFVLPNFPKNGTQTNVAWLESQQNFVVTGSRFQGIEEGLCKMQQGQATDTNGGRATIEWSNPCLLSGNLAVLHVQVPNSGAQRTATTTRSVTAEDREHRAATSGSFFLCDTSISIQQQDRTFGSADFRLVDLAGNEVCRELPPNTELGVFLQVDAKSTGNALRVL
ncbi:MAG: hypothetical protein FJ147_28250 [Deltaproteobacteria bacterium]|nr:hypothetical protein [Deltaproteobacteria bacterium]